MDTIPSRIGPVATPCYGISARCLRMAIGKGSKDSIGLSKRQGRGPLAKRIEIEPRCAADTDRYPDEDRWYRAARRPRRRLSTDDRSSILPRISVESTSDPSSRLKRDSLRRSSLPLSGIESAPSTHPKGHRVFDDGGLIRIASPSPIDKGDRNRPWARNAIRDKGDPR